MSDVNLHDLPGRVAETVKSKVKRYMSEAADGSMSAEELDSEITNLIDSLIDFQKQAKPHVDGDADLEAALTSRINTSVAQLSQLKKKMSVAMSKKNVDSVQAEPKKADTGDEAPKAEEPKKEERVKEAATNVNLNNVPDEFLQRILNALEMTRQKFPRARTPELKADIEAIQKKLGFTTTNP